MKAFTLTTETVLSPISAKEEMKTRLRLFMAGLLSDMEKTIDNEEFPEYCHGPEITKTASEESQDIVLAMVAGNDDATLTESLDLVLKVMPRIVHFSVANNVTMYSPRATA
jgi:hypothetical protein